MYGQRIRELRKEKKLTMKELGRKLNLAESTISGYENEQRKPDLQILHKIADFFGVDTDYLLGRSENPNDITNDQAKNAVMEIYSRLPQDKKKIIDDMIKALGEHT